MTMSELMNIFGSFSLGFGIGFFGALISLAGILAYAINPNYISKPLEWIRDISRTFIDLARTFFENSPKPIKVIFFLGLLLIFGNVIISPLLSTALICDNKGVEYVPNNPFSSFLLTTITSYQTFSNNTAIPSIPEDSRLGDLGNYATLKLDDGSSPLINIGCDGSKQAIRFYTMNIFSYQLWLMLIMLSVIIGVIFKFRGLNS